MGVMSGILGLDLGGIASGVAGAIDKFVETPDEKVAAKLLLAKMEQEKDKWQVEVNKIEAGHRSLFIAGARPAMMWLCVMAMGMNYLVNPTLVWITTLCGNPVVGPQLDIGTLFPIITGMLGISGLRTYEKQKKLTK